MAETDFYFAFEFEEQYTYYGHNIAIYKRYFDNDIFYIGVIDYNYISHSGTQFACRDKDIIKREAEYCALCRLPAKVG